MKNLELRLLIAEVISKLKEVYLIVMKKSKVKNNLEINERLIELHAKRIVNETLTIDQWQHLRLWRARAEARYQQGIGDELLTVADYLVHDSAVKMIQKKGTFDID